MKVLVESSKQGTFWQAEYAGYAVEETPERYLVRHGFLLWQEEWVPKDGGFRRCREIKEVKRTEEEIWKIIARGLAGENLVGGHNRERVAEKIAHTLVGKV